MLPEETGVSKTMPLGDIVSWWRAIIELAPMAIIMVNAQGDIVLVNQELESMFAYNREELLGRRVEILTPARFRSHHPELRRGFLEHPQARRMGVGRDLYGVRKDGSEFPVEIGLNPIESEQGLFVLSTIVDITERKQLEEKFRATVESAPLAMIMIDRDGRIVLVNAEAARLFAYDRQELLGQSVEQLVPARFHSHHPDLRADFLHNPQARRMGAGRDLYGVRKDGTEFPVEIGLNPIEIERGIFVLSAIVDITERKQMEQALRNMNEELEQRVASRTAELANSNEALERSNLELQQFAYIASHDLQAPLRGISGFVQLLQQEYGGKIDERADEWIRRAVENTHYMQTLIQDLLSYSQVDSRSAPFTAVNCSKIFDEVAAMLEASIQDVKAQVTRDALPTLIGDRSQLAQLFLNLVGNGLKYHGDKAPCIHVSAEVRDNEWLFSVRDNGIGIAAKYHDRIFDIFGRLHTRQAYPGTGIGLAVCRRVVHRHGGRIWVESIPGEGSTFYFTIPERSSP